MSFQTFLPKRDPTLSFLQHFRYIDNFVEVEYDNSLGINHIPNSKIIKLRFQDDTYALINMNRIQNNFFQKEHFSRRFEYYFGNQNHILPLIMTPFTTPGLCYIKSKIIDLLALDIVKINVIFNTSFVGRRTRMIQMNRSQPNVLRANSFYKRINKPMFRSNQVPNLDKQQLLEWNETQSPSIKNKLRRWKAPSAKGFRKKNVILNIPGSHGRVRTITMRPPQGSMSYDSGHLIPTMLTKRGGPLYGKVNSFDLPALPKISNFNRGAWRVLEQQFWTRRNHITGKKYFIKVDRKAKNQWIKKLHDLKVPRDSLERVAKVFVKAGLYK